MHRDMRARLETIAQEDSEREEQLGKACPSVLNIELIGGASVHKCWLVDGLNSVDESSIDVERFADVAGGAGGGDASESIWVIAIAHIAAVQQIYPSQRRLDGDVCHRLGFL